MSNFCADYFTIVFVVTISLLLFVVFFQDVKVQDSSSLGNLQVSFAPADIDLHRLQSIMSAEEGGRGPAPTLHQVKHQYQTVVTMKIFLK